MLQVFERESEFWALSRSRVGKVEGRQASFRDIIPRFRCNEKLVHLHQRLHRRIDLLPPNFVRPDNSLLLSPESNGGEQIVVVGNKRAKRPLSTEYTETHYSRKQLPSSPCVGTLATPRPISWILPKVNFSKMVSGAEIMTVDERSSQQQQALTTTCSRITTDL